MKTILLATTESSNNDLGLRLRQQGHRVLEWQTHRTIPISADVPADVDVAVFLDPVSAVHGLRFLHPNCRVAALDPPTQHALTTHNVSVDHLVWTAEALATMPHQRSANGDASRIVSDAAVHGKRMVFMGDDPLRRRRWTHPLNMRGCNATYHKVWDHELVASDASNRPDGADLVVLPFEFSPMPFFNVHSAWLKDHCLVTVSAARTEVIASLLKIHVTVARHPTPEGLESAIHDALAKL